MDAEMGKLLRKHQKRANSGRCLFVDSTLNRCAGKAISSHTVQKGDALRSIAEEGHVYQLGIANPHSQDRPRVDFINTGLRKASVFPGFCKRHDNAVFLEIEKGSPLDSKRQAALLGYRVICLEIFKKDIFIQLFSDDALRASASRNGRLNDLEGFLHGSKLGLADPKRTKSVYENALHQNRFDEFHAAVYLIERPLPFCFASTFAPEFDFNGSLLLPELTKDWEAAAAFAGTISGQSVFLLCGFNREGHHEIRQYVQSMSAIPLSFAGSAALHTALEYAENTFFRKSWVDFLDLWVREKMKVQFGSGTPGTPNRNKARILELEDLIQIGSSEPPKMLA